MPPTLQRTFTSLTAPDRTYIKLLAYAKSAVDAGAQLVQAPNATNWRKTSLMLTVKPWHTMLSAARLFNLYDRAVDVREIPGAVVECGVWRGGGLAMMGAACADVGTPRDFWAFDSFAGLPPPGDNDTESEHGSYFEGLNLGDPAMVREIWHRLGLPPERLRIMPGWFEDTVPSAPVGQIALLHADGDWYDSVMVVLDALYDKVAPGGVIVVDDYHYWEGSRRAVNDFLNMRDLPQSCLYHDAPPAVYFHKPHEDA